MRAGRLEEADELTARIGKEIKQRNKVRLSHVDGNSDVKTLWIAVRQLVGRKQDTNKVWHHCRVPQFTLCSCLH